MRHESNRKRLAAILAGPALALVLTGCGGTETPEPEPASGAEPGPLTNQDLQSPAPPEHVATPRGTDEIYDEIVQALETAYSDLGSPSADFRHLSDVQTRASKELAGAAFEWPSGTSYSLSVLDDRVSVYINCEGEEKRGEWAPGNDSGGTS